MPSALCFWVSVKGAWSSWRARSRGSRRSWCQPRRRWTQRGCRGTSWRARGRVCMAPWPGCAPSRPAPPLSSLAWAHRLSPSPSLSGVPPPPRLTLSSLAPASGWPPWSPTCVPWPITLSAGHSCSWGTLPGLPACLPWLQPWTQGLPSTPGASPLRDRFQAPPELQLACLHDAQLAPHPTAAPPDLEPILASLLGDLCPPRPRPSPAKLTWNCS